MIHGCTVGNLCLVGMGSVLLDGCSIGDESIVAAGSLVPPGFQAPPRSFLMGRPVRLIRSVTDDEVESMIRAGVRNYLGYQKAYRTDTDR
jgi:carbonic anhydrase/acetyltransferase-like protein (isoleucine patch superfamily)